MVDKLFPRFPKEKLSQMFSSGFDARGWKHGEPRHLRKQPQLSRARCINRIIDLANERAKAHRGWQLDNSVQLITGPRLPGTRYYDLVDARRERYPSHESRDTRLQLSAAPIPILSCFYLRARTYTRKMNKQTTTGVHPPSNLHTPRRRTVSGLHPAPRPFLSRPVRDHFFPLVCDRFCLCENLRRSVAVQAIVFPILHTASYDLFRTSCSKHMSNE